MERVSRKGARPVDIKKRIAYSVVIDEHDCWIWQKSKVAGYGRIWVGSRTNGTRRLVGAHRAAFIAFRGEIPEGLYLDHLCRTPSCVNPWHLEAVTPHENLMRGDTPAARNAAKTHCPRGHEYTSANTRLTKGKRYCRACHRIESRARYADQIEG